VIDMDTRTPASAKKDARRAARPRIVEVSRLSGPERVRELDTILRRIDAGLRRKGMTPADRRDLRKWIENG
jgi:hypothetical protein